MSIVERKKMGETVKSFIETVENNFITPKKEEYYSLLKEYKSCRQIIKDINFRKKIRRRSITRWLRTWVLYFWDEPISAFKTIKNTKRTSDFFINEYWILKRHISEINTCINELDDTLDQFELFHLAMDGMDKKFETIEKQLGKYENQQT